VEPQQAAGVRWANNEAEPRVSAVDERATFSLTEHDESDGCVRVRLVGELDLVGSPQVQTVLRRLEGGAAMCCSISRVFRSSTRSACT